MNQLVGAVSIAVQRGTAMSFLSGYTRAMLLSEEEDYPQSVRRSESGGRRELVASVRVAAGGGMLACM